MQKRKNLKSFSLELNGIFFMYFYVPFHFYSKSFSILLQLQKQHFASLKRIGVTQKEEKCHFSFSLIERHFFMHFYVPFHFFKVPFDFVCLPKAAFCKDKAHRGTSKGAKCHFFFL